MDKTAEPPRRWDPIVKLTHWGIVAAVIGNALVTEEGSGWHVWVGYGLGGLLALRLLWGLIGPAEARFSAFPPSPARAMAHLGEIGRGEVTRHRSHNPLGALMVYAIWGTLLAVIGSGIAMSGPPPADPTVEARHEGRESGHDEREEHEGGEEGEEGGEALEELHEIAVNLLYVLIGLHLLGVVFESRRSGGEVVRAMLPGGGRRD